ncbi:MAG: ATP-dependent DNA helicase RecQ [Bacteroidota bacterium]
MQANFSLAAVDIHQLLEQNWGYKKFRPLQEEIIQSVLAGNDTLALLPTGGGKSICFQVPALAMEGICLVISPLIALMKDQVEQLKKRNIQAIAIYSGMSRREIDVALDNCVFGKIKFLYLSPERLQTEIFLERVKRMNVCLLAVDEAHCISAWGESFRPPYAQIADFRLLLPQVPVIALTATATEKVKIDIQEKLSFVRPNVFQQSFARSNLSYSTYLEEDKERRLLTILQKVSGTAIVYVRSRKRTKAIAEWLQRCGIRADYYHAGLDNTQRSARQDAWIQNRTRVIVATNAFGMGIDKPDVRIVVHLDLPDTLEAYYQEAGRAGRDERKAYAVVLYNPGDVQDLERRVLQSYPAITVIRHVYQALANYYKLAVGSSQFASYDFDLEDFKDVFQLNVAETYQALKRLEEAGFIQLNESYYNPSKLYFTVDNRQLYEFQVANAAYDPLIKLVLRMYGGEVFTNFMTISENAIAKQLHASVKDVIAYLTRLHQQQLLVYDQQKDKPQLTFLTPRYDAADLPLEVRLLENRKQRDLEKARSVKHYVQHTVRCRTQLLLEYFGEITDQTCGVCDICLQRKKLEPDLREGAAELRERILYSLQPGELSLQNLVKQLKNENEKKLLQTVQAMVGVGELRYLANGNLVWVR